MCGSGCMSEYVLPLSSEIRVSIRRMRHHTLHTRVNRDRTPNFPKPKAITTGRNLADLGRSRSPPFPGRALGVPDCRGNPRSGCAARPRASRRSVRCGRIQCSRPVTVSPGGPGSSDTGPGRLALARWWPGAVLRLVRAAGACVLYLL